mgnify:CR=1 FL=1
MFAWGKSDIGRVRKENQDSYAFDVSDVKTPAYAVVCDGMGGAAAGNVASRLAVDTFIECVKSAEYKSMSNEKLEETLISAARSANQVVHDTAKDDNKLHGMGTTLVAVLAERENVAVINIGDSRAYKISQDGISRITRDHSLVEDMVRMGELTEEQAQEHPGKNLITRAVGTDSTVSGDTYFPHIEPNDYILLCSDGLSNLVTEQEILFEVLYGGENCECCNRLVDIANERGGYDNITVVLLSF